MRRFGRLAVYAILSFGVLIVLSVIGAKESEKPKQLLSVRVAWSDTELVLTNVGAPETHTTTIYLNGTPPNAYKATVPMPANGQQLRIPLRSFVDRNGQRFSPLTQAVTIAWVGGDGFDYASYQK